MSVEDDAVVEMAAGGPEIAGEGAEQAEPAGSGEAQAGPAGEQQPGIEAARERRPPPKGARCDACHERGARVRRTTDGLLAVCSACARGVDVSVLDSTEAIAALVPRVPAGERRLLARRLTARRAMHTARRERRVRLPSAARAQVRTDTTSGATPE